MSFSRMLKWGPLSLDKSKNSKHELARRAVAVRERAALRAREYEAELAAIAADRELSAEGKRLRTEQLGAELLASVRSLRNSALLGEVRSRIALLQKKRDAHGTLPADLPTLDALKIHRVTERLAAMPTVLERMTTIRSGLARGDFSGAYALFAAAPIEDLATDEDLATLRNELWEAEARQDATELAELVVLENLLGQDASELAEGASQGGAIEDIRDRLAEPERLTADKLVQDERLFRPRPAQRADAYLDGLDRASRTAAIDRMLRRNREEQAAAEAEEAERYAAPSPVFTTVSSDGAPIMDGE